MAPADLLPRSGVLVIDKPDGPTSRDAVQVVRKKLGVRSAGHAGTLDPMATGVLIVALGEATKLVAFLTAETKHYLATIRLGAATDTLDARGAITESAPLPSPLRAALGSLAAGSPSTLVEVALQKERERREQVPPAYSAIRVDGVRAHRAARRGENVVLAPREVRVLSLAVTGAREEPPELDASVHAEKGYYVRSLAHDLAESLGTFGHLTSLRRTASGSFTLADAVPLEASPEELGARLLSIEDVARRVLPSATLTEEGVIRALHGKVLQTEHFANAADGLSAWFRPDGTLAAVGTRDEPGFVVVRGFPRPA